MNLLAAIFFSYLLYYGITENVDIGYILVYLIFIIYNVFRILQKLGILNNNKIRSKKVLSKNLKTSSVDLKEYITENKSQQAPSLAFNFGSTSSCNVEYLYPPISLVNPGDFKKSLRSIRNKNKLSFGLINDITNQENKFYELSLIEMPNLLIGGTIMSGKTTLINQIICSILMRAKPNEVKLLLMDSKKIEFSVYNGIPHLLTPVITDSKKANVALKRIVVEMERRYDVFEESSNKNIESYNSYIDKKNEGLPEEERKNHMPFIVVIIDDINIIGVDDKESMQNIEKITKLGYICGIHIVLVANHPSHEIISTLAQSNFPSRISFKTVTKLDSRIVLDEVGAERLNGKGKCLYKHTYNSNLVELSICHISDDEIKSIVEFASNQQKVYYDKVIFENSSNDYEEPLYNEIVEFVVEQGKASASLLQRRFRLGYNRASRCIDLLEDRGIIGPQNGSKPREVLVKREKL